MIYIIKKLKNLNVLLLVKTGLGSAIAIFLASQLNLLYSVSAGIITLLTIQNTRKETLVVAFKRIIAFFIALLLAFVIFNSIGYSIFAFGVFIFIFTAICNLFNLKVGITVNAVLVSHILTEANMGMTLLINEALLLLIGMSIGIIVNSIMPSNKKRIKNDQIIVEAQIRDNLFCLSQLLKQGQACSISKADYTLNFVNLNELIDELLAKAYEDAGNTFINETRYQISYLEMRRIQVRILMDIFANVERVHNILPQSIEISQYVNKVATEFHENNNVEKLTYNLQELYDFFRKADLPKTREEFENRAILFNVLRDLEHFLQVKKSFIETI